MQIPALKITIEPCSDGMTVEGKTIVTGQFTTGVVDGLINGRTVVIIPSRTDAAGGRADINNLFKVISLLKQKITTSGLTAAIDALSP